MTKQVKRAKNSKRNKSFSKPRKNFHFGISAPIVFLGIMLVLGATLVVAQTNSNSNTVNSVTNSQLKTPTVTFAADKATINKGETTYVRWSALNASSCSGSNTALSAQFSGALALSGSRAVSPSVSTSYTLLCKNVYGQTSRSVTITVVQAISFIRGDVAPPYGDSDGDGIIPDVSDIAGIFNYFPQVRPVPSAPVNPALVEKCKDAADVDGDGDVDVNDGTYLISHLFGGGPAPKPPYPTAGANPLPLAYQLGCKQYP